MATTPEQEQTADLVEIHRMRDLTRRVGLSPMQIQRMVKLGLFPKPVRLAARSIGWRSDEITNWIACRTEAPTVEAP